MENYTKQRLDRYLRRRFGQVPQSLIEKAIRNKDILVNNKKVKSSERVSDNDDIYIHPNIEKLFSTLKNNTVNSKPIIISNENLELFRSIIIYEDNNILAVNKPAGMAVQLGTKTNTALDVLAKAYNPELRLVHRIDKETSGITIFAKSIEVARYMLDQFKNKLVQKVYIAILSNKVSFKSKKVNAKLVKEKDRVIVDSINGKSAITEFTFIKNVSGKSVVEARPVTGRTHQIRVHLSMINAPILGDRKYGGLSNKHLFLHSHKLFLKQYKSKEKLCIIAPVPEYFKLKL